MNILILEDSDIIARGVCRYLQRLFDDTNIIMITKIDDIETSLNDEYDLAIIDYCFAFNVYKKIKCKNKVLISGSYLGLNKKFLLKPFDEEDLLAAIEGKSDLYL